MDFRIVHALDTFAQRHDGFEDVLRAYVNVSEYLFMAVVAVLALAALLQRGRQSLLRSPAAIAGGGAALALLVGKAISTAVDRPRPFVTHHSIHDFLAHAPDAGMPSDHATAAFAIATAVFLTYRRAGVAAYVAATILAIGRVFLGVHYVSDVIVGAALGVTATLLVAKLVDAAFTRREAAARSSPPVPAPH